jgi:hypothetical protein
MAVAVAIAVPGIVDGGDPSRDVGAGHRARQRFPHELEQLAALRADFVAHAIVLDDPNAA